MTQAAKLYSDGDFARELVSYYEACLRTHRNETKFIVDVLVGLFAAFRAQPIKEMKSTLIVTSNRCIARLEFVFLIFIFPLDFE